MKILAVLSFKGGPGKTTISLHLSVAAELAGQTVAVFDLDPQESAVMWKDIRQSETPAVISADVRNLSQLLEVAESNGATLTILDTPPNDKDIAAAAVRAADLVIIPSKAAPLDVRAIASTIQIVKEEKTPGCVVLNAVPARGNLPQQAQYVVENTYQMPCAPCTLGHRIAFVHAITDGLNAQEFEPKGKAATEINALYNYIAKQMEI